MSGHDPLRALASWEQFVSELAKIAEVPPDEVQPDTRLIEDLSVDSVALAEIVVMLIHDYGVESLSASLEAREWEGVTAHRLYEEYRTGRPAW